MKIVNRNQGKSGKRTGIKKRIDKTTARERFESYRLAMQETGLCPNKIFRLGPLAGLIIFCVCETRRGYLFAFIGRLFYHLFSLVPFEHAYEIIRDSHSEAMGYDANAPIKPYTPKRKPLRFKATLD